MSGGLRILDSPGKAEEYRVISTLLLFVRSLSCVAPVGLHESESAACEMKTTKKIEAKVGSL